MAEGWGYKLIILPRQGKTWGATILLKTKKMPVPSTDFKKIIKQLSDKEKEAIILKAVRRDAELYELLAYELLPDLTLEQVSAETLARIEQLLFNPTGRIVSKGMTRALRQSVKEIARFKRITKDAKAEIDLHLAVIKLIFDHFSAQFDSPYKTFFATTARLVLRATQLVRKNLHPDYHLEYKAELDEFLGRLHSHRKSSHLSFSLPASFEVD